LTDNPPWIERNRERTYWWGTVALLASSPVLISMSVPYYSRISPDGGMFSALTFPFLIAAPIAALVLALLIELIFSRELKVWMKHPAVTIERRIEGGLEQWYQRHSITAREAGFILTPTGKSGQWHFRKPKKPHVYSFLDNPFSGSVLISDHDAGPVASLTLVLDTIVIIETGELAKMRALADHLLGGVSCELRPDIPFMLATCVVLGFMAHISCYLRVLAPDGISLPDLEASFFSVGEALWMTAVLLGKRSEAVGLRIAVGMILAGGAPIIALALGKI
jgi:hypothetical protein